MTVAEVIDPRKKLIEPSMLLEREMIKLLNQRRLNYNISPEVC